MAFDSRRGFLKRASAAGIAISANHLLAPFLRAQTGGVCQPRLRFDIDSRRALPALDRNIFALSWSIWDGPSTKGFTTPIPKFADANGFRKMCWRKFRSCKSPLSAIQVGISFRATTGWTA